MKSVISLPTSCKHPPGLPEMLLASPPFSVGGVYISFLVLPCWTPSPSLALTLISMLGSKCHLKTLKPGNGYGEGRENPKAFLSPSTTSASLPPSQPAPTLPAFPPQAFMSLASVIPWSPRERPASGSRSQPCTVMRTSTAAWKLSPRWDGNTEHCLEGPANTSSGAIPAHDQVPVPEEKA